MLNHNNLTAASAHVSRFLMKNDEIIPERLLAKANEIFGASSPVPVMLRGMELLYTLFAEDLLPADKREDALNALGAAAFQVASHGFAGKTDRAAEILAVTAFALGETNPKTEPTRPALDPEYAPPAPPEPEPGEGEGWGAPADPENEPPAPKS